MNTERHPSGRGCWGGATAILLIAGAVTASALTGLFALSTSGGPAVPANAPAAVVQTLAPTTTDTPPAVTTTPPATTTAPAAAPRALVSEPTTATTTEEPTVPANPPATDANGVRVAPSNPNANQPPSTKDYGQAGLDANGNPVGPPPSGGTAPQGQPPTG